MEKAIDENTSGVRTGEAGTYLASFRYFISIMYIWLGGNYYLLFFLKMAIKSLPMQLQNGCVSPIALISRCSSSATRASHNTV